MQHVICYMIFLYFAMVAIQGDASPVNPTSDDATAFNDVMTALAVCDFSQKDRQEILAIVASILHLGNTGFVEENGEAIIASSLEKHLMAIAEVNGCLYKYKAVISFFVRLSQIHTDS